MTETDELCRYTDRAGKVWSLMVEHYPHLIARWRPVT